MQLVLNFIKMNNFIFISTQALIKFFSNVMHYFYQIGIEGKIILVTGSLIDYAHNIASAYNFFNFKLDIHLFIPTIKSNRSPFDCNVIDESKKGVECSWKTINHLNQFALAEKNQIHFNLYDLPIDLNENSKSLNVLNDSKLKSTKSKENLVCNQDFHAFQIFLKNIKELSDNDLDNKAEKALPTLPIINRESEISLDGYMKINKETSFMFFKDNLQDKSLQEALINPNTPLVCYRKNIKTIIYNPNLDFENEWIDNALALM